MLSPLHLLPGIAQLSGAKHPNMKRLLYRKNCPGDAVAPTPAPWDCIAV